VKLLGWKFPLMVAYFKLVCNFPPNGTQVSEQPPTVMVDTLGLAVKAQRKGGIAGWPPAFSPKKFWHRQLPPPHKAAT